MDIKIIFFGILLILQDTFALDGNNCTTMNTDIFIGTADDPKTKFYLFTNKNFYNEQEILTSNVDTLINSNFNASNPTRILVHGWKNSLKSCFNGLVKDAYLQKGDFNVFVVDWSDWSHSTNYFSVAEIVNKIVAEKLGNFTQFLNIDGKVPYDNMYLIGHSLGAHLSGAAGRYIKSITSESYDTIFGLDPAGPEFYIAKENERLSPDDAVYVEQISTNMAELGYEGVLGKAAFFPNYGRIQPYCITHPIPGCSHGKAYTYFAESIKNNFCSVPCPYYASLFRKSIVNLYCSSQCNPNILMGGEPSVHRNGTYYVKVNYQAPFANCNCII